MPFALNEATRYISPTKTLEYMACGRPSVSTSIRDVVEPYGHVVNIADTPEGFVIDCEAILERTSEERAAHAQALAEIVARTSWDSTAQAMAELIAQADEAIAAQDDPRQAQPTADDSVPLHLADAARAVSVVGCVGAGKASVRRGLTLCLCPKPIGPTAPGVPPRGS